MAERFIDLSLDDRRDALEVAAQSTGRPPSLLEKDVWVVWALDVLFRADFRDALVFKGGTSLSKAYGIIDRFSEDVDLTYDIRRLIPELATDSEIPPSRNQADRWTDAVREALPRWLDQQVVPALAEAASALHGLHVERSDTNVFVHFRSDDNALGYVRPRVLLEFGARSTGEPTEVRTVTCDASQSLPGVAFPTAEVRAMRPTRTFWEKATAAHVYCVRGGFRGAERWSRHWYDIVALLDAGAAAAAVADRPLAEAVAAHKSMFFREAGVDYHSAVSGDLRIVPPAGPSLEALREDFARMVEAGMFVSAPPGFDELIERCRDVERLANHASEAQSQET
jgi:hypothetical protein